MKFLVIYCPECKIVLGKLGLENELLYCKECEILVDSHGEVYERFKNCIKCGKRAVSPSKDIEKSYMTNYDDETFCYPCWAKKHNIAYAVSITNYLDENLEGWR